MYESFIQDEEFNKVLSKQPTITLVPLHNSKFNKSGYNQVEYLAIGLGKKLDLKVQYFPIRTRQTKPQFGLKREERMENVKGAFEIRDKTIFFG